jgi:hypothetical protein
MAQEIDIIKQVAVNIKYKNNSTFDLQIRVTKDDGTAYTLTGKVIRMDIKENRDNQSYTYRLVSPTDITISDTNLLTWSKVMELPEDLYHYDVYIVDDSYYIMGGLLKVERNVTT